MYWYRSQYLLSLSHFQICAPSHAVKKRACGCCCQRDRKPLIPAVVISVPNAPNIVVVSSSQLRSTLGTLALSAAKNCKTRCAEAVGFSSPIQCPALGIT